MKIIFTIRLQNGTNNTQSYYFFLIRKIFVSKITPPHKTNTFLN